MVDPILRLFDNLDRWRHLPYYQLERRADVLFAVYLPEILSLRFGRLPTALIPEFPIHKPTIDPTVKHNRSFKIDYLAVIDSGGPTAFVELKTNSKSRNPKQDEYLLKAKDVGIRALLAGIRNLHYASSTKTKFSALLSQLETAGLIGERAGAEFKILANGEPPRILYVQPKIGLDPENEIGFEEIAACIGKHQDVLSRRFAESLYQWSADANGSGESVKQPDRGFKIGIRFTREQLVDDRYDPIANSHVDLDDLRKRYEGHVDLNHAAAVRGVLVKDRTSKKWLWIWGIGLLHDEITQHEGYSRLYGRYRNQYPLLPRIEFEDGANASVALSLLLEETPIKEDDPINVESRYRRGLSIRDYLSSDWQTDVT